MPYQQKTELRFFKNPPATVITKWKDGEVTFKEESYPDAAVALKQAILLTDATVEIEVISVMDGNSKKIAIITHQDNIIKISELQHNDFFNHIKNETGISDGYITDPEFWSRVK